MRPFKGAHTIQNTTASSTSAKTTTKLTAQKIYHRSYSTYSSDRLPGASRVISAASKARDWSLRKP